jgi:di/tripeptidase
MRFVVKTYDDGKAFAVEITDDGSSVVKSLKGSREVGQRLSAFVEVLGDDTEEGVARIKEALEYLRQIVEERGAQLTQKTTRGAGRKK